MAPRRETSGLHGGRMVLAWVGTARSEEARRAALAVIAAAPDRQGSGASGHSALNGDFRGGHVLVLRHVAFVVFIWRADRAPPALGEVGELAEASDAAESVKRRQAAGDLLMIFAGVVAMAGGTTRLVDALQRISGIKSVQTRLGLTIVGFELVVLAWSAAPRRTTEMTRTNTARTTEMRPRP